MSSFAALFPGQGSQSVGMLSALAEEYAPVREAFAEASEVLGYDLWQLVQQGPDEQLRQTQYTQPAMFVAGVAVWRAWLAAGGAMPSYFAGHSLGEYSALTAAGSLPFAEAVALVARRGQLMADAAPGGVGGMAAVLGLDDEAVRSVCAEQAQGEVLEAVNFNSPGQVVVSGHVSALERALPALKAAGAKRAVLLPVSVPNHSALMNTAQAPLAASIAQAGLAEPRAPVVQNLLARPASNMTELAGALQQHVNSPVYWTDSVRYLAQQSVPVCIEFGPGKVLTGLVRRIDKSLQGVCIDSPDSLQQAIALTTD